LFVSVTICQSFIFIVLSLYDDEQTVGGRPPRYASAPYKLKISPY